LPKPILISLNLNHLLNLQTDKQIKKETTTKEDIINHNNIMQTKKTRKGMKKETEKNMNRKCMKKNNDRSTMQTTKMIQTHTPKNVNSLMKNGASKRKLKRD
jgi:hypothetical protein